MDRMGPGLLELLLKNYDETSTDKGVWHTKQILAELIQPGDRTIHCEILQLINPISNREEKPQQ
jgi:hypothetical protein